MGGNGQGGAANAQGLGYENGTRLVARNYVADDGAKQFKAFYDSEIKTECSFARADDGELRCLPNGPQTLAGTLGARYSDASCTKLVVTAGPACAEKPTHAVVYDTCGGAGRRVFAVGTNQVSTIYLDAGGCQVGDAGTNVYYELGAEIDPSAFVAAVVE